MNTELENKDLTSNDAKPVLDEVTNQKALKEYICTDCGFVSLKFDNGKICVGLCDECEHPLWNSVEDVPDFTK